MMRMVLYLFLGAMLFAGAATGSMLLARSQVQETPGEEAEEPETPVAPPQQSQPPRAQAAGPTPNPRAYATGPAASPATTDQLPVAVRPTEVSAAEAFRLAQTVGLEREALDKRIAAVEQREARIQILYDDLEGQQQEFEGLLKQIQDAVEALAKIEEGVKVQQNSLQQKEQELEKRLKELTALEEKQDIGASDNAKTMAGWLAVASPELAAAQLKTLVNEGKMELVVELVSHLDKKKTPKIFETMNATDPDLVTAILTNYHQNHAARPKSSRRR